MTIEQKEMKRMYREVKKQYPFLSNNVIMLIVKEKVEYENGLNYDDKRIVRINQLEDSSYSRLSDMDEFEKLKSFMDFRNGKISEHSKYYKIMELKKKILKIKE